MTNIADTQSLQSSWPIPVEEIKPRAILIYALAIFLGAFLLFQVQPLIGKYILPWFGGSPGVWTTCLLFFQTLLVGGYAYAHLSSRMLSSRQAAVVHLALLIAAIAVLPVIPSDRLKPSPGGNPTVQILILLSVCVGLPYFVLSATGPLLQSWFARLNPGVSPYRLYALSNAGSLLALLSYPFVVEPNLSRPTQGLVWSCGLGAFRILCAICGRTVWGLAANPVKLDQATESGDKPAVLDRLLWLILPAIATTLLLAETNKICQDVAVWPFLWILPLSLYLLTFIICFDHPRWYYRPVFFPVMAASLVASLWLLTDNEIRPLKWQLVIHCMTMFACCMVCHGELTRRRPHPDHLTGFYLSISVGGALGGLFVAVVSPLIFKDFTELPLGLAATFVFATLALARDRRGILASVSPMLVWIGLVVVWVAVGGAAARYARPRLTESQASRIVIEQKRNFYGVLTVLDGRFSDGQPYRQLRNGIINHGTQLLNPELRKKAISYYDATTGIGLTFANLRADESRRVGVVGLGTGTIAAYGKAGDYFRFYEINPQVIDLARRRFTYISDSPAKIDIALGDARLSMEHEPAQNYDIIALDAFSGDAIPIHLLTREAFEIYLGHLRKDGVLAVHISNRHLELQPVVEKLAAYFNLGSALIMSYGEDSYALESDWMLLTRNAGFLSAPEIAEVKEPAMQNCGKIGLWTDDESNLFKILK